MDGQTDSHGAGPAADAGETEMDARARSFRVPLSVMFLLAAVVMAVLVPLQGDFPLNDDWVYAKAIKSLLEEGTYRGHPYMFANPVLQIFSGALITDAFGFDYTYLRLFSYVLGFVAAWASAKCAQTMGLGMLESVLCGLLVIGNPIVLNLSYTFMTDVPFLCFVTLSGLFYLRALGDAQESSASSLLVGSVFAGLAYLIRQFGVLMPAAFAAAAFVFWFRKEYTMDRRKLAFFVAPVVVAYLVTIPLNAQREYGTPMVIKYLGIWIVPETMRLVAKTFCYFGLFMLPVLVVMLPVYLHRNGRWRFVGACAGISTIFFVSYWYQGIYRLPQLFANMIYDIGVGPVMVLPGMGWKGPVSMGQAWWAVTFLGTGAGAMLLYLLVRRVAPVTVLRQPATARTRQAFFLFCWMSAIVLSLMNPWMSGDINIRYIVPALVPALVLLLSIGGVVRTRTTSRAALALTFLFVGFSVVCVQDYMAWNRARWEATDALIADHGISIRRIHGGYEFGGEVLSDLHMAERGSNSFYDQGPIGAFAFGDDYVVTMLDDMTGYDLYLQAPYFSWLGMRERFINVWAKRPAPGDAEVESASL